MPASTSVYVVLQQEKQPADCLPIPNGEIKNREANYLTILKQEARKLKKHSIAVYLLYLSRTLSENHISAIKNLNAQKEFENVFFIDFCQLLDEISDTEIKNRAENLIALYDDSPDHKFTIAELVDYCRLVAIKYCDKLKEISFQIEPKSQKKEYLDKSDVGILYRDFDVTLNKNSFSIILPDKCLLCSTNHQSLLHGSYMPENGKKSIHLLFQKYLNGNKANSKIYFDFIRDFSNWQNNILSRKKIPISASWETINCLAKEHFKDPLYTALMETIPGINRFLYEGAMNLLRYENSIIVTDSPNNIHIRATLERLKKNQNPRQIMRCISYDAMRELIPKDDLSLSIEQLDPIFEINSHGIWDLADSNFKVVYKKRYFTTTMKILLSISSLISTGTVGFGLWAVLTHASISKTSLNAGATVLDGIVWPVAVVTGVIAIATLIYGLNKKGYFDGIKQKLFATRDSPDEKFSNAFEIEYASLPKYEEKSKMCQQH